MPFLTTFGASSTNILKKFLTSILNIQPIEDVGSVSFSYIEMPGNDRTLLSYITSFGVSGGSTNTGQEPWNSGFSGSLFYVDSPLEGNDYFTRQGRVKVISGDGSSDGNDWAIFDFGIEPNGDFDGRRTTSGYGHFGGENTASGGTSGLPVTKGYVWGFSEGTGWVLLYEIDLPGDNSHNHSTGNWFDTGGVVTSGEGKRSEYNTLVISHIGFSVR